MNLGCGGRRTYPAGGVVQFKDGAPLTAGWVSFRSLDDEEHVTARGQVGPDGTFTVGTFKPGDGAGPGRHKAIVAPIPKPDRTRGAESLPPPARSFDPRFSNYDASGFEFVVTDDAAANQFKLMVE